MYKHVEKLLAGPLAQIVFFTCVLFSFLVSSLIPDGYMPSAERGWTITICSFDGPMEVFVPFDEDDSGENHEHEDPSQHGCVYSGIGQFTAEVSDSFVVVPFSIGHSLKGGEHSSARAGHAPYRSANPRAPPVL